MSVREADDRSCGVWNQPLYPTLSFPRPAGEEVDDENADVLECATLGVARIRRRGGARGEGRRGRETRRQGGEGEGGRQVHVVWPRVQGRGRRWSGDHAWLAPPRCRR